MLKNTLTKNPDPHGYSELERIRDIGKEALQHKMITITTTELTYNGTYLAPKP